MFICDTPVFLCSKTRSTSVQQQQYNAEFLKSGLSDKRSGGHWMLHKRQTQKDKTHLSRPQGAPYKQNNCQQNAALSQTAQIVGREKSLKK